MQDVIDLLHEIRTALIVAEEALREAGRGTGARELALARTQLQSAEDWAVRAYNLKYKELQSPLEKSDNAETK